MGKKALPTLPPAFGALFEGVAAAIATLSTLDSEAEEDVPKPSLPQVPQSHNYHVPHTLRHDCHQRFADNQLGQGTRG